MRDVLPRHPLRLRRRIGGDQSGARIVGQAAGLDDGPVEVTAPQVRIRRRLGPQVDLEDVLAGGIGLVRAHGGHHEVAPHPCTLGGVREQDRRALVHRLLPGRARPWPATGREDHGVRSAQDGGHLLHRRLLQVKHGSLSTGCLQIGHMGGIADDADRPVTSAGEHLLEQQGDLAVPSGDHDAHLSSSGFDMLPSTSWFRHGCPASLAARSPAGSAGSEVTPCLPARQAFHDHPPRTSSLPRPPTPHEVTPRTDGKSSCARFAVCGTPRARTRTVPAR